MTPEREAILRRFGSYDVVDALEALDEVRKAYSDLVDVARYISGILHHAAANAADGTSPTIRDPISYALLSGAADRLDAAIAKAK